MKPQEYIFNKQIKIFQIYRDINYYDIKNKSYENRKETLTWNEIQSKSGYVNNNVLFLPEQILKNPDFKNCDLILIIDNNHSKDFNLTEMKFIKNNNLLTIPIYNHCINLNSSCRYEIFEIIYTDRIELHFKDDYFSPYIPRRNSFKLCDLTNDKSVEIKINGKSDFSTSSRKSRLFVEKKYIFDFIGGFDNCKILREPYEFVLKSIPVERKIIDLNKRLW